MMQENHISFTVRAPFYTLNDLNDQTKRVWIVFHGYGQLSRFFVEKFKTLDPAKHFILAPQGLSKHYRNGFTGRVGASWMTKEDRLTEIENQYAYLDEVMRHYPQIANKQVVFFGFSQGVSTMCRYAAHAKIPFSKMILWAGTFPPELTRTDFDFLSGSEEVIYYTGDQDPFYEEGMKEKQEEVAQSVMGIRPTIRIFSGGHQVVPELLKAI